MKKLLIITLVVAVITLNATALLRSNQKKQAQEKPVVAKPLRLPLKEVPFVFLPNLVKA